MSIEITPNDSGLGIVKTFSPRNQHLVPRGVNEPQQYERKTFRITSDENSRMERSSKAWDDAEAASLAAHEDVCRAREEYFRLHDEMLEHHGCVADEWEFSGNPQRDGDGFIIEVERPGSISDDDVPF